MKKPVYKLLDEKGRILIPKEFRQMAELESGDIVKLSVSSGKIMVSKVDIVEMGSQDPQAVLNSLQGVLGFEQHNVFGLIVLR